MPAQLQLPTPATTPAHFSAAFTAPANDMKPDAPVNRGSALERRARLTARLAKLAAAGHLAPWPARSAHWAAAPARSA